MASPRVAACVASGLPSAVGERVADGVVAGRRAGAARAARAARRPATTPSATRSPTAEGTPEKDAALHRDRRRARRAHRRRSSRPTRATWRPGARTRSARRCSTASRSTRRGSPRSPPARARSPRCPTRSARSIEGHRLPNGLDVRKRARAVRRRRGRLRGAPERDDRRGRAVPEVRQRDRAARLVVGRALQRGAGGDRLRGGDARPACRRARSAWSPAAAARSWPSWRRRTASST